MLGTETNITIELEITKSDGTEEELLIIKETLLGELQLGEETIEIELTDKTIMLTDLLTIEDVG